MVSLVLVSHSKPLAESLVGLIRQMAGTELKIGIAAGAGEDHAEFGTDATQIAEVITAVDSPDGVLILMDLGSAILSAEMALELLPADVRGRVHICPAPLVEGSIAAGVQASLGSDLSTVCREARQALLPKIEQLHPGEAPPESGEAQPVLPGGTQAFRSIILTLQNEHGLHARPAARFVQLASSFEADIRVTNLTSGSRNVSAKSLNALATLGALNGHQIEIQARGEQAAQALDALKRLVDERFGESRQVTRPVRRDAAEEPGLPGGGRSLSGLPVSEGIAIGSLFHYEALPPSIPDYNPTDRAAEWQKLISAIQKVRTAIRERQRQMTERVGADEAAIFEAHALLLDDEDLLEAARQRIEQEGWNSARAWKNSVEAIVARFQALQDDYLKQRAADVQDVGNQVLRELSGESHPKVQFSHPVILVADDLTPTETASLDLERVLGIALLSGGPTSHSAILARSLGIPAITGLPMQIKQVPQGCTVALDGFNGQLWIEPQPARQAEFEQRRAAWQEEKQRLLETTFQPAITRDNVEIEVAANVGNLADAQAAVSNGADGIGLLRTEFLFLTRQTAPSEEEQYLAIRDIGVTLQRRPVIVRTLDVGGDKPLPYINQQPEANPFLGVRALRLSLQQPPLFRTQLRAILRAGAEANLRIMFPMVASVEEVQQANRFLEQVHQELVDENAPHAWPIKTGIMVEIPAAAILADALAEHVAFFSIGTNDLTQYTMAAERGNPQLSYLNDALHPSVLRMIERVVAAADQHGKWVGVCGELAGEAVAVAVLVGLGVRELSVNPAGIPRVKAIVRALNLPDAQILAGKMLACTNAASARQTATDFLKNLSLQSA